MRLDPFKNIELLHQSRPIPTCGRPAPHATQKPKTTRPGDLGQDAPRRVFSLHQTVIYLHYYMIIVITHSIIIFKQ